MIHNISSVSRGARSPGWVLTALGAVGFSIFTTRVRSSGGRYRAWTAKAQRILRGAKMFCQNLRKRDWAAVTVEGSGRSDSVGFQLFVTGTHRSL